MRGLRLGLSLVGTPPLLDPLTLSPTAWYDPSDISTMFKDTAGTQPVTADGDAVARINDKSGNGNHLLQATAGSRPLYKTSGGLSWLLFDGTDDFLVVTISSLSQPFERVSAIQQLTWTADDVVFANSAGNLRQQNSSPSLQLGTSSSTLRNTGLAMSTNGVVTEHWEGASSSLQVNNGTVATGDALTTAATTQMSVAAGLAGGGALNMRLYWLMLRGGTMTAGQLASVKTLAGGKCGLSL